MTPGMLIPRKTFPRWIFPFALAFCGYALLAFCCHAPGRLSLGIWWSAQAVGWICCAWYLHTLAGGWPATRWIVVSALAFRCCGLWAPPTLEDDYQRYLWDGWRTIQDGSPYDRAPVEFFSLGEERPPGIEIALNELNNPGLTTIYPPVTQYLFAAAAVIAPGSLFVFKLLLLAIDGAVILLLAACGGRSAAWFYGWCPLAIAETAFHAHADAWAVMWLLAAWVCARRERFLFAGALAGVAVGAKIFALLAAPFLIWRRPWLVLPAFLIALGLIYAPFLAAGSGVEWSALHTMASSFEFNSFGYALLAAWCGAEAARVLWLALAGVIALSLFTHWAWKKRSQEQAPVVDLWLAFLLFSPVLNPWYLIGLVPFVALQPTRRGVALLLAVPLSYATGLNLADPTLASYAQPGWVRPVEFGIFFLALLSEFWPAARSLRRMTADFAVPANSKRRS